MYIIYTYFFLNLFTLMLLHNYNITNNRTTGTIASYSNLNQYMVVRTFAYHALTMLNLDNI